MLSGSEKYYDDIYAATGKDYVEETNKLHELIQKYKCTDDDTLLDVACGTGKHAGLLSQHYKVTGVDVNAAMLKIARKEHPEIHFSEGDMRDFHLRQQFGVITCLFSAIGYMTTKADLQKAITNMSRHLLPGGVMLVEPWFTPEQWHVGRVYAVQVDKPDMKIVRMSHSGKKGKCSDLDFFYLIGTSKGIEQIAEKHLLGLFTHEEYMTAFGKAKLNVIHDVDGLDRRGIYIGTKSL